MHEAKKKEGQKLTQETKQKKDILILAIESSCDETAAAVVKNGQLKAPAMRRQQLW